MIGAPALSATAALRAGCGLAKLVMPEPILADGIGIAPSATGIVLPVDATGAIVGHEAAAVIDEVLAACDCIAVGPGLGEGDGVRAVVLRCVQQEDVPVVIDADAINALAGLADFARDFRAAAVLTPHPGEYRRLAKSLSINADPVKDRAAAAEALAQRLGCVVVLKGANTVVTDGQRTWTSDAVNPALATAGTGDVLTGLIGSLIAQHVGRPRHPALPRPAGKPMDLFDASRVGVFAHALAAARWAERSGTHAGLLAHELCDLLPGVLESIRGKED